MSIIQRDIISDHEKPENIASYAVCVWMNVYTWTVDDGDNKHFGACFSRTWFSQAPVPMHCPSHPCKSFEFLNLHSGITLRVVGGGLYFDKHLVFPFQYQSTERESKCWLFYSLLCWWWIEANLIQTSNLVEWCRAIQKTSVLIHQCSRLELPREDIDSRGSLTVLTDWSK